MTQLFQSIVKIENVRPQLLGTFKAYERPDTKIPVASPSGRTRLARRAESRAYGLATMRFAIGPHLRTSFVTNIVTACGDIGSALIPSPASPPLKAGVAPAASDPQLRLRPPPSPKPPG